MNDTTRERWVSRGDVDPAALAEEIEEAIRVLSMLRTAIDRREAGEFNRLDQIIGAIQGIGLGAWLARPGAGRAMADIERYISGGQQRQGDDGAEIARWYSRDELARLLIESLKRLGFAKRRDPNQAGLYHYRDAIEAVGAVLGEDAADPFAVRETVRAKLARGEAVQCLRCKAQIAPGDAWYRAAGGGALCPTCWESVRAWLPDLMAVMQYRGGE